MHNIDSTNNNLKESKLSAIEHYNETEEILLSLQDIEVVINYYWDSHGKLVESDGPNGNVRDEIHAENLKIIEKRYDVKIGSIMIPMNEWALYINNEKQKIISVESYNMRKRLFIKAIVGQG